MRNGSERPTDPKGSLTTWLTVIIVMVMVMVIVIVMVMVMVELNPMDMVTSVSVLFSAIIAVMCLSINYWKENE